MHTGLVVGRVGSCSTVNDTECTDAVRVHGLATAIYERIVGVSVGVGSVCRRVWAGGVSAGVTVAVRVGHARGEGGGHLAVGARSGVAPASVTAVVFGHGQSTDSRKGRIVVGVEAILLDFFPAFVLGALALLAFAPEEDAG